MGFQRPRAIVTHVPQHTIDLSVKQGTRNPEIAAIGFNTNHASLKTVCYLLLGSFQDLGWGSSTGFSSKEVGHELPEAWKES